MSEQNENHNANGDERHNRVVIQLDEVSKTYQMGAVRVDAVKEVSLSIKEGEFLAVTGASGSGKSTLVNMIGCLDTPTGGTYMLDGQDVGKLSSSRLADIRSRKVGFVFQTYSLLPRMTALANVELPMMYGRWRDRKSLALHALDIVGLSDRTHHKPTELSGGQQQRVGIARALVKDPTILIADEPTGNLDSKSTSEILDVIIRLNREQGITVIVVTHEPDVAAVADRVIAMHDGEIASDRLQTPVDPNEQSDAASDEPESTEGAEPTRRRWRIPWPKFRRTTPQQA